MQMVASIGIATLDAMTIDAARQILIGLYKQLATDQDISTQASKRHIAKAARRQRHPDWSPPDNWGGDRTQHNRRLP